MVTYKKVDNFTFGAFVNRGIIRKEYWIRKKWKEWHTCWSFTLGNRVAHVSIVSFPKGAAAQKILLKDLKSNLNTRSCFASEMMMGGTKGRWVARYVWMAVSMFAKSYRGNTTSVIPRKSVDSVQCTSPKTWNMGNTSRRIWSGTRCNAEIMRRDEMKFPCVMATPLLVPVVPDEYNRAAVSSCVIRNLRTITRKDDHLRLTWKLHLTPNDTNVKVKNCKNTQCHLEYFSNQLNWLGRKKIGLAGNECKITVPWHILWISSQQFWELGSCTARRTRHCSFVVSKYHDWLSHAGNFLH
jgi:hypothetical protein